MFEKAIYHQLSDTTLNKLAHTGNLEADLLAIIEAYLETIELYGEIISIILWDFRLSEKDWHVSVLFIHDLFQRIFEDFIWLRADDRISFIDHISWDTCHTNLICLANLLLHIIFIHFALHTLLQRFTIQPHLPRGATQDLPLAGVLPFSIDHAKNDLMEFIPFPVRARIFGGFMCKTRVIDTLRGFEFHAV